MPKYGHERGLEIKGILPVYKLQFCKKRTGAFYQHNYQLFILPVGLENQTGPAPAKINSGCNCRAKVKRVLAENNVTFLSFVPNYRLISNTV